jgi:hypothetical protein
MDGANMGGTWTSATNARKDGRWQAIPKRYFREYLELADGLD